MRWDQGLQFSPDFLGQVTNQVSGGTLESFPYLRMCHRRVRGYSRSLASSSTGLRAWQAAQGSKAKLWQGIDRH